MPLTRREFAGALAGAASAAARPEPPNVLILFTDDQRFNTLHALNCPEIQTPNMDRLVRSGIAFTRASIMGGTIPAVCAPSRGMLMTGQTLFHVADNLIAPNPAKQRPYSLFPEEFARAGYTTFATGKWHNGPKLFNRCFQRGENIFFGGMADHTKMPLHEYDASGRYPAERVQTSGRFSSELFADSAIRFINQHPAGKPFLAYTAFTAPHDPRIPPKRYLDLYPPDRIELPPNFMPRHPFDNGEMEVRDEKLLPWPRTPKAVRQEIASYYAMITEVDAQIGRILDALAASPHARNTIVVFAGDNGLAMGQHGLLGKQNLYEHSIRVPLVIGGPGIPGGHRADGGCYLLDVFPTLCDLAGLKTPATVEGQTLMPALRNPRARLRQSMFFAYRNVQRAVWDGRWKLIRYHVAGNDRSQLFDLERDPWEMHSLRDERRTRELSARLSDWMHKLDDPISGSLDSEPRL
jgi:arylsulfatase A-like enzyme